MKKRKKNFPLQKKVNKETKEAGGNAGVGSDLKIIESTEQNWKNENSL